MVSLEPLTEAKRSSSSAAQSCMQEHTHVASVVGNVGVTPAAPSMRLLRWQHEACII